jgi:hypothetical protein
VTCTVSGYGGDPRELADIPEAGGPSASGACGRAYVTLLDVATAVRELLTFNGGAALGAWEVWRIARGGCGVGRHEVPVAALAECIKRALAYLNTVAEDHRSQA